MSSTTLQHFSHPKHPLILKEDVVVGEHDVCYGCNGLVVGIPTYTCTDIDCHKIYLHKSCAELPQQLHHPMHSQHPLSLVHCQHPFSFVQQTMKCACNFCDYFGLDNLSIFKYICEHCDFYMCVNCATQEKRPFHHEGHKQHKLRLMLRKAWFICDACGRKELDASYICTTCEFLIHKTCASSPAIVEISDHHHALHLMYSIPDIHRTFTRYCNICTKIVEKSNWLYYCHKCTYFVHMTCTSSGAILSRKVMRDCQKDCLDDEPDLLQIPLPTEESLLDLLIKQFDKFQVEFQGESSIISNDSTISLVLADPPAGFIRHWSHENHLLELLQFSTTSSCDQIEEDDDDTLVLVCDACVLPITDAHPSYYACAICQFFLHSFCATKLPFKLPAGASPFHPNHLLTIRHPPIFFNTVRCDACGYATNGFYYHCEDCSINVEIRCALFPNRIKHESHKQHPLVRLKEHHGHNTCQISQAFIDKSFYGCKTCDFYISSMCAFFPSRLKHKYDSHLVTFKSPPFFYEGVIYCQICEDQVDNQWWLYHCDECDQSFHTFCLRVLDNIKTKTKIGFHADDHHEQHHTLTLVVKRKTRIDSPRYICRHCKVSFSIRLCLECDGCGYLICYLCADEVADEVSPARGFHYCLKR